MGAASLKGLQFYDRLLIMLMPVKYQPDYMFLRQVKQSNIPRSNNELIKVFIHSGSNQTCPPIHIDTTSLPSLPLAY